MAMRPNRISRVSRWASAALTTLAVCGAVPVAAQIPDPTPAINAAKNARAKTEAAQQKNAEALAPDQTPAPAAAPSAAPARPATADKGAPASQGSPVGYSYDPAGRRDPFVSLTARGSELAAPGTRPAGVPGILIGEATVKGIFKSPKGGFLALLQAPDGRTYSIKQGDKVFDGSVKAINQDAVVFSQDVNDPLSLVKQREVRKSIRPEAR
jgi:hypothetical protein